uniref:Uncharacterized protein n=1 Tax=Siphoviridae sp. ct2vX3 TaxID=2825318 RepID=A0A8S5PYA5_9CAUD|nr:MAG TPA: hypothetical protein [Siphoviridae sp. ct2vX3]
MLTNHKTCVTINTERNERGNQMEWFFVGRVEAMGVGYDEYTNEDNTKCRQVWDDGYEEIFEIS